MQSPAGIVMFWVSILVALAQRGTSIEDIGYVLGGAPPTLQ